MYVILGATGHVGSAAARTLLERGAAVTVVTPDASKAADLAAFGATVAEADVGDVGALRAVFRTGTRAFLLNPPADVASDIDVDERRTAAAIVAALDGSGLEVVLAESTYGARPGEQCGDLGVLHDFEQALAAQPIPAAVIRAGFYMTNWDAALATARDQGVIHGPYPAELILPMVSSDDLGRVAADLLAQPALGGGIHYVEGPERYAIRDVAAAFAEALGEPVRIAVTPREDWVDMYRELGFSEKAAQSFANMAAATVDGGSDVPDDPIRGTVTLEAHIRALVLRESGTAAS